MDNNYQRIILVTDALQDSQAATESAYNLATKHGARVTVVDTLKPPSTAARWLSSNASDVFEMVLADKQQRLEKIAARFREAGVEANSKVLLGRSSESIVVEAIDSDADLVVRYMKGVRSKYPGAFGNTARNLMRICPCPILLVGQAVIAEPRVLACVNAEHDKAENAAILASASQMAGDNKLLFGLYCWNIYGDETLKHHMGENSYQETLQHAEDVYGKVFDKFSKESDLRKFENGVRMEHGDPAEVIPEFCQKESIDIVVMSSASLNHPVLRLLGSTIESVLDKLPCSLLVVKPEGFKSPIAGTRKSTAATG
jgi:universal stress protein E